MADQNLVKGSTAPVQETRRAKAAFGASSLASGVLATCFGAAGVIVALVLAGSSATTPSGEDGSVRLLPVTPANLEAALQTIAPEQRDQIREEIANCKTALFMMSVGPIPQAKDAPSGFVQLRIGSYTTPRFPVTNTLTNFAVPHPIPEAKTLINGEISVMGSARSLRVSFSPYVDYPVLSGSVAQPVYFDLPQACGIDQGNPAG